MTDREARLITLVAQAVLALEATMLDQIAAVASRVAEMEAAVNRVAQVVADLKAQRDAAIAQAGDMAALQAQFDDLSNRLIAATATLNAQ